MARSGTGNDGGMVGASSPVIPSGVTTGDWVLASSIFAGSLLVAYALKAVIIKVVTRREHQRVAVGLAARLAAYVVGAAGFVYALGAVHVRIGPVLAALGVGGIAVAFALQDFLRNLVAGIVLQVSRPIRRGEQAQLGSHEGVILDVTLRQTEMRTFDGEDVFLPNTTVLQQPIVNYTRTPNRRTTLDIGVGYGCDLERARTVALEAMAAVHDVAASPPPEAWVTGFADSAVTLAVRFWHPAAVRHQWRVRSEVAIAVQAALKREGIEIPFPQRVLTLAPPPPPEGS